jgi:hypothetical protein
MYQIRGDLGQGRQHEEALMEARVRHYQPGLINYIAAIEKQVGIYQAGPSRK